MGKVYQSCTAVTSETHASKFGSTIVILALRTKLLSFFYSSYGGPKWFYMNQYTADNISVVTHTQCLKICNFDEFSLFWALNTVQLLYHCNIY